jgi:hypothetical protein
MNQMHVTQMGMSKSNQTQVTKVVLNSITGLIVGGITLAFTENIFISVGSLWGTIYLMNKITL